MTSNRRGESLPLLHKYVLQPQDDLQLVLTKLNYRLCVKEVSKVIYRRSLGASISEAVDIIENTAEMNGHHEVEPLVLSHEGPQCVSSPKTLSPDDSYCGTMKSDDSGIVMDESHMNFSGDQSDIMFSSAEVSPLEEDNHILNGVKTAYLDDVRDVSVTPEIIYQEENEPELQKDIEEHITESPDISESTEETITNTEIQVEEIKASSTKTQEATPVTEDQPTLEETNEISADLEEQSSEQQSQEEEEIETEQKESTTQEEQNESETEQKEEEERVDFVKDLDAESGIRCDDVYTALQILKTRYKLSDTTVRRFIITFSSWDVSQMSYPISNRCSWWDDAQHVPADTTEIEDLTEDIYTRQGEISELVDRIMEEEQVKHNMLQKLKKEKEEKEAPLEENIEPAAAPKLETEPAKNNEDVIEDADNVNEDNEPSDKDSKQNKKKNRNAWQRFVHALRKRMRRNSSRPPAADKERAKA